MAFPHFQREHKHVLDQAIYDPLYYINNVQLNAKVCVPLGQKYLATRECVMFYRHPLQISG